MTLPIGLDIVIDDKIANGQSNGEYGTVILRLCGIDEKWFKADPKTREPVSDEDASHGTAYEWRSSVGPLRRKIEALSELIKLRQEKNVRDSLEMEKVAGRVDRFLSDVKAAYIERAEVLLRGAPDEPAEWSKAVHHFLETGE